MWEASLPHAGVLLLVAPSLPGSWGALLPLTRTGLLPGLLGCLQMGEMLGLGLWAFTSPTGTCEQCAFKTSRRAIVSPSLLLIVACFSAMLSSHIRRLWERAALKLTGWAPSGQRVLAHGMGAHRWRAAPGAGDLCARSRSPVCLSFGDTAGLITSPVPLTCVAVASSRRSGGAGHPTPVGPRRGSCTSYEWCFAGAWGPAVGDAAGAAWCLAGDAVGCRGNAWLPERKVTATNSRLGLLHGGCPGYLQSLLSGLTAEYLELLARPCWGGTEA